MNETPAIEVMTNFKNNNIIIKKGKFFIYVELSEVDHMLKECEQIYSIMTAENNIFEFKRKQNS